MFSDIVDQSSPVDARRPICWLLVLFALNIVCYADRTVVPAVVPLLMPVLALTYTQGGALAAVFWVTYTVCAPVLGWASDSGRLRSFAGSKGKESLLALGVLVWGLLSFFGALVGDYTALLVGRMGCGLGQAAFATLAPIIIADLFPPSRRGPVITFFYVAISLGSAIGYASGGFLGAHFGWQYPLIAVGVCVLALRLPLALLTGSRSNKNNTGGTGFQPVARSDHGQDAHATKTAGGPGSKPPDGPPNLAGQSDAQAARERLKLPRLARTLVSNKLYLFVTLGMAAADFGLGGLAFWMPTFYHKIRGMSVEAATMYFGACTAVAGIVGTVIGGWVAERLQARRGHAADCPGYFLLSAIGMFLAVPFSLVAILATDKSIFIPALFLAEVAIFLYMGPSNTILLNVLMPSVRATGFALNILAMHMLGSVPVTVAVGAVWDKTGNGVLAALVPVFSFAVAGVIFLMPVMRSRNQNNRRDTEAQRIV